VYKSNNRNSSSESLINGNATNWLLWGGLAVALGTGGYLIYSYYANPKGKKK